MNSEILKSVGQGVGQLVAALGVEGLAQVLTETLSVDDLERLAELLRRSGCQGAK